MMLHDETIPFSSASTVARLTEWHIPASSAWMIRYLLPSAGPAPGSEAPGPGDTKISRPKAKAMIVRAVRMGVSFRKE